MELEEILGLEKGPAPPKETLDFSENFLWPKG